MEQTTPQILGQRIALLRRASGMSQEQVASLLHVSRSTYAYYESGKSSPSLDSLRELIQLYCPENPKFLLLMDDDTTSIEQKKIINSVKKEKLKGTLSSDEIQLLAIYRSSSESNRNMILQTCLNLANPKKEG